MLIIPLRPRVAPLCLPLIRGLVALEVLDVALLFLLLHPLAELFGLLLSGELGPNLGLDLLKRAGLRGLYVRNPDYVVAELGLDGAHDLPLLGTEDRLLELGYGLSLAEAAEVSPLRGAARVLGVLLGELREVSAIFQLFPNLFGFLFLVLVEEDMPYAALRGRRELGLFVLLVVGLDLFF